MHAWRTVQTTLLYLFLVLKKNSTSLLDADSYLRSYYVINFRRYSKASWTSNPTIQSMPTRSSERQAYLAFCQKEAKRIFDSLLKEILDGIIRSGRAFVNVVGKYDNIFKYRISKIIKEMFKQEGLEIHLSNSIGIAEINITWLRYI